MGIELISGNTNIKFTAFAHAFAQQMKKAGSGTLEKLPGTGTGDVLKELTNDRGFLKGAIDAVKNAGDIFNKRLDFRVDEATNRIVVKVIDTRTDKVIKEIPPEQLVELAAKIQEMIGLLVDEER